MAAATAYMLSLLGRQHQLLGASFFERYPSDWLVWEPGPSRPARSILTSRTDRTLLPTDLQPPARLAVSQDSLCFELKRVQNTTVTVGRAAENEIVINDLTVSREQFVLEFTNKAWVVRGRGTPLMVDHTAVSEAGATLKNGSVISAGEVRMTFYSPEGFPERLAAESKKHG